MVSIEYGVRTGKKGSEGRVSSCYPSQAVVLTTVVRSCSLRRRRTPNAPPTPLPSPKMGHFLFQSFSVLVRSSLAVAPQLRYPGTGTGGLSRSIPPPGAGLCVTPVVQNECANVVGQAWAGLWVGVWVWVWAWVGVGVVGEAGLRGEST